MHYTYSKLLLICIGNIMHVEMVSLKEKYGHDNEIQSAGGRKDGR